MSKFTFGTTPNTTAATGFSFTAPTQTPGFGATGATTFGAAAATPAAAAQPAAQTTATPGLNFSFGAAAAAPQTTQPTTGLTLRPGTGISTGSSLFQTQATTQAQQPQLGQQPAQNFKLSFTPGGAAKPPEGGGLTFGTPTTGGLSLGLNTATGTTTTGGLSFGAAPTTGGLSFGATTSTAVSAPSTSTLSFGTTPASTTLSFGSTPASTALSFGATPATTTTSSLFSTSTLFGAKPTTTAAAATTVAATTVNRGLGGLDVSVTNKGLAQGSTTSTSAKENLLPNELMQTIDGFKEFVKTQKALSSDIARGSARPLNRCAEDTASLMEILTTLAGSVQRDRSLTDRLKHDTAKALQNAEIAQRTHDTPAGLQYENNAPLLFFMELADNFEHDLMLFKSQIESTEKHIQTMMTPKTLTPQELTMAMNKLHESLVAVAGKLQGVHSKVQQQKEQYLNFRKYVLKDTTNVFEDIKSDGKSSRSSIGKITSGPTPFGPGNRSFLPSSALSTVQTANYGTPNALGKN